MPLLGGKYKERYQNILNKSYLAKWVVIGILIGTVAGVGSTFFYYLIQFVTDNFLGRITGYYPPNPAGEIVSPLSLSPHYYLIPISTMLGGLVVGIIIYFLAPEAEGHGTDAAIDSFHNKNGYIRKRVPIVKMIASAITIGSGGSAGREGPTAQISAGFGSFLGSVFGLSSRDRRIAVAAGIGAGIGSIFKSPFGGAILSAEILYSGGDMEVEAMIPAFIASPVGYVIFASMTNFSPIFGTGVRYTFSSPINLLIYALLGLIAGGVGRVYTYSFYKTKELFSRLKLKKFLIPMIGGGLSGVISIFFPEVTGMGYGYIQFLIDGKIDLVGTEYILLPTLAILVSVVFLKIMATSFTVGSGGSGGVFAPSLVIGGFTGASLWVVLHALAPNMIVESAPLVIVGMMALFAGVGRTPIAVILMVSEMTGTLNLMIPAMVAVVISYYIVGPNHSIYRSQVRTRADSPAHRGEYSVPVLARVTVEEVMTRDPVCIPPSTSVAEAARIIGNKDIKGLPVCVDGKLVGIVVKSDLMSVSTSDKESYSVSKVMTRNVITSTSSDSLLSILKKMTIHGIGRIPVISDDGGRVVGIVSRGDLYKAYEKFERDSQEERRTKELS